MKSFRRYCLPPLYGLLIYATVRLVNDAAFQFKFWERHWSVNAIEIAVCSLMGYFMWWLLNRSLAYFDRTAPTQFGWRLLVKELLWVALITEATMGLTMLPMAAFTDDGLSAGDIAMITVIPLLYAFIHYGIVRSDKALKNYTDSKVLLEKITNDKLEAELKLLRAQYHPHFLFNALNTIYFQMDEDVGGAKKSVEKFSELLRYQLYDQQQTVPLQQEIHYLNNYIDLQKTRSSEKLQLSVQFHPSLNGQRVYPLLFLPFVENAFKYVGGCCRIDIELKAEGDSICFRVVNSIPEGLFPPRPDGIGLDNLKRRLALLYPGRHTFHTEKQAGEYLATLTINLA